MIINCPECGGKVSDKARKCPHCGVRIKKRSYAWLIFFVVMLIIIACAGGWIWYEQSKKDYQLEKFERVLESDDIELMQDYLDLNPNATEAQKQVLKSKIAKLQIVLDDWNDATRRMSRTALEAFIHNHPESEHVMEAKNMIDSLDWQTAKKENTEHGYRMYMDRHSNGQYFYDANDAINKLREARERAEMDARFANISDSIDKMVDEGYGYEVE